MAVVKQPQLSKLVIRVETGLNGAGKPVYRMRSFKNIKTDAKDDDVFAIGEAIAKLQKYPAQGINRIDDSKLINQ